MLWENKIIFMDAEAAEIQGSSYANVQVNLVALYEDVLDRYGAQGWELASMLAVPNPKDPEHLIPIVLFKRPIVSGADV